MGFKKGDLVRVMSADRSKTITYLGSFGEDKLKLVGETATIQDYSPSYQAYILNVPGSLLFYEDELVRVVRSIRDMKVGDVLTNMGDGDESVVQAVFADSFIHYSADDQEAWIGTFELAERERWRIRGQEEKETVLTMQQVADLAKVDVNQLRIKKD
jgi:hypothetical protein